jgi:hypothetical protein
MQTMKSLQPVGVPLEGIIITIKETQERGVVPGTVHTVAEATSVCIGA